MELDTETIRASMPLLGVVLGGLIASISAWLVAKSNQAGARAIARDNARRDDLLKLLGPLRAHVAERTELLESARSAAQWLMRSHDPNEEEGELERLAASELSALAIRSPAHTGAWSAAGDPEIVVLYRAWLSLDAAATGTSAALRARGRTRATTAKMKT